MNTITELISKRHRDYKITHVQPGPTPDSVTIKFVLTGHDFARFVGSRTFSTGTLFADSAEFVDELWAGSLDEVALPTLSPPVSRLWVPGAIATAVPVLLLAGQYMPDHMAALMTVLAVMVTAVLWGSEAALFLTGAMVLLFNMLVIDPTFTVTFPKPFELATLVLNIGISLIIPTVMDYRSKLKTLVYRVEQSFLKVLR